MTKLDERPDVDFELLFGEMPATPCEGPEHGKSHKHDDGPGTQYWQMQHDCWLAKGSIYVLCERRSKFMMEHVNMHDKTYCLNCDKKMYTENWVTYAGPVGK